MWLFCFALPYILLIKSIILFRKQHQLLKVAIVQFCLKFFQFFTFTLFQYLRGKTSTANNEKQIMYRQVMMNETLNLNHKTSITSQKSSQHTGVLMRAVKKICTKKVKKLAKKLYLYQGKTDPYFCQRNLSFTCQTSKHQNVYQNLNIFPDILI